LNTVVCFIEYGTWSGLKDFLALELKGASARSLKMRQNIFMILTVGDFPVLNGIKSKMDFFKNEYLCKIKGS
jgi:hypothetical protein